MINFNENIYLDQYRDLNLFYKEYVGEPKLKSFITYDKMKRWYSFQTVGLQFQVDHISPKKIRPFENMLIMQSILLYIKS